MLLSLLLLLPSMAESTRYTATSDRLEDALTKLTTHQLYLTHMIQQLMHKIDALIHHLPQPAPPSHFPSSSAITASHGCLSLYSDHARPHHPLVYLFPSLPLHTTIHQQLSMSDPSLPSQYTPSPYIHPTQFLGIDFESTRIPWFPSSV